MRCSESSKHHHSAAQAPAIASRQEFIQMIEITLLHGSEITNYTELIGQWRIQYFREFPYLYQGTMEYEAKYLAGLVSNPHAVVAVARDNAQIIGFVTALPLVSDFDIVKEFNAHFQTLNRNIQDYCYIGEIIIHPDYRGNGLALEMTQRIEQDMQQRGFKGACFLCVVRDPDHPLRPADYLEIDGLCQRANYIKTDIVSQFEWPTIQADGSCRNMQNPMVLWIKAFEAEES